MWPTPATHLTGSVMMRMLLASAHAITRHLIEQHAIKALVVACNTATAAAIRESAPNLSGFTDRRH